MTRLKRLLPIVLVAIMLFASAMLIPSAETLNGWVFDFDGAVRYYVDGEYVTGQYAVGNFIHRFDENDGSYLGVYDGHTNVGVANTSANSSYENSLKSLVNNGSAVYGYYTFDDNELYTSTSYSTEFTFNKEYTNGAEQALAMFSKVNGVFTSDSNRFFQTVNRYASFILEGRAGGGRYIRINSSDTNSAHSYFNIYPKVPSGTDFVFEAEYMLANGYSSNQTLVQFIDRNNVDAIANAAETNNYMPAILNANPEGGVYVSNNAANLVCVLSENELTRISIAVHPSTNTMDIYVNGLLVSEGEPFITSDQFTAENFALDEIRTAQFNGINLGSMIMDNVAVYAATEPVCTVTAEPRNGLALEGNVLRYYVDNRISVGRHTVNGTYLGVKFDNEVVNFGGIRSHGGLVLGANCDVVVDGVVKSSEMIPGNVFVAPEALNIKGKAFCGWKITDGERTTLVAPGQTYFMYENSVCEAATVDFEMLDGASIRTTSGSTGIRFMAKLDREQYDSMIAQGLTIEPHIMIVPTAYLDKTYGYHTIEALEAAGYTERIDVTAGDWYAATTDAYYYTGSVANILPENYMLEYSGVAYLKVTYPDGSTRIIYADYDEEVNSRSVYRVAHAAYNDRSTVGNVQQYTNSVKFNGIETFSPYDYTRLSVIKKFADKVIMLESDRDNVVAAGAFYNAPYTVNATYNNSTKKYDITITPDSGWSLSEAFGVVMNGEVLSADDYTVGETCSLSVATGGVNIADYSGTAEDVNTWLIFDASSNFTSAFSGKNTNSAYTYDGESASAKLAYTKTAAMSPSLIARNIGKYTASGSMSAGYYWDMSDVKAMTFAIYSTLDSQTIQMNIHSENSGTDGIDYYGRKLSLRQGWNYFALATNQFGSSRSPLGWNHITSIQFTPSGWDQVNNTSNVIYISNIYGYDSQNVVNPFSASQFKDTAAFYMGGYYACVNGEKYKASTVDIDAVPFERDGKHYVPMATVAAAKGATGNYYPDEGILTYTYSGNEYVFNAESRTYTVNGSKTKLTAAPIADKGALFFAAEDVMSLFGYSQKYVDRMGLVVLSNTADIFDEEEDFDIIYDAIECMTYIRPAGEKIVADLNEHSGGQHPYLMIDAEGFDKLRYYANMDSALQGYIDNLEAKYGIGTDNFTKPQKDVANLPGYKKSTFTVGSQTFEVGVNRYCIYDGQRLLDISRNVMNKTISWALLAKLYEVKDPERAEIYAERVWIELEAACNYIDPTTGLYSWHPQHFLDTGELAYPTAICYDWLYDYWVKTATKVDTAQYGYANGTTRLQILEDAMYWMALSVSNVLPSDTTGKYVTYNWNISGATNNWNGVCNGGLMAAALAICNVERYADNVELYINSAITAIERGMWVYAPEGGYEEGPGYWSYGTTYTAIFISCLNSACGTNYGIYNAPGFAHSVYFTTYLGTKNTTWGFHDGGSGSADTNIAPWFAKQSNDPNVNAIRRQALENGWKGSSMYDIMFYDPHIICDDITLNLDAVYSLDAIMTFRSSWDADNNIFAGLHGGDNAASHGDLDMGNFVINVNGTFMICDLGSDAYNMAGYFGNYRWSYYRKRAEGQNTLVMIPSSTNTNNEGWDGKTGTPAIAEGGEPSNTAATTNLPTPDQIKGAISEILRYESGTNSALGVVEMDPAFEQMTDGIRGMWMTDNRNTVIVQDEAVMSEDMDIWWFAHVQSGTITVSEDGRSAVIGRNGIYLYAEIITDMDASASFSVMDAESLDRNYTGYTVGTDYYTGDTEYDRSAFSKLTIRVDDCSELRLAVAFTVIGSPEETPELGTLYQWTDIADWKVD